jgi:D-lactate dehydrogenase
LKFSKLEGLVVFVNSVVDEAMLDCLPSLKFVMTMSTGYDHIDIAACSTRGIVVCSVPSYGENTVAEQAFALLLALSRKIVQSVEQTKLGHFGVEGLCGFDLKGKTLGVLGTGKIGRNVVRIGLGFGMKVLLFDAYPDKKFAQETGCSYVSLDKLLSSSDIVTLHMPYMKQTHHFLNRSRIGSMKRGAYVINTARGGLVDTSALVWGLKSGKIAGAGLDVLEEENTLKEEAQLTKKHYWKNVNRKVLREDHKLLRMKNVLITPHNAFNTKEALMRIVMTTVENINGFKRKKLVNVVNVM